MTTSFQSKIRSWSVIVELQDAKAPWINFVVIVNIDSNNVILFRFVFDDLMNIVRAKLHICVCNNNLTLPPACVVLH